MMLTDSQLNVFISKVLHLGQGKRKEFINQVDYLIGRLKTKIDGDSSFSVTGFKKTGSLIKGTVLKPRGENGVDADIAVYLDVSESDKDDVAKLHEIIRGLLIAVYPTKQPEDFQVQPRTLGIHFRDSGLDVDLVPVIPIDDEPGFAWQPSSRNGEPVKTHIQGQLNFIASRKKSDSRYRSIVRLAKKWRNEQELEKLRSFAIELIVAHLYDNEGAAPSLESGLQRFFLFAAQSELKSPISFPELGSVNGFPSHPVVILDPVNADNNVTMRLTDAERAEIVAAAQKGFETIEYASWANGKGDTIDLWKELMGRSFTVDED